MLAPAAALVPAGGAVATAGSAVVTAGSAVVTAGSAVVTAGSAVVTAGRPPRAWLAGATGSRPAATTPVLPGPAGQRLARAELSKSLYHPHESLQQRFWSLLSSLLAHAYQAGAAFPGGWWSVLALATALALALAVIATQLGPLARARRQAGPPGWGTPLLSAAGHRRRAREHAQAGDYSAAILETVRAIGRELEERGVLVPRLGRTAGEIAAESALALPGEAAALLAAARLFDDVCYGGRPGTADGCAAVRELDERILVAAPRLAPVPDSMAVLAGTAVTPGGAVPAGTATPPGSARGPA